MYRLRYFFDFGSGICLWAANDAARDDFDYPVHSSKLPITSTLMQRVEFGTIHFSIGIILRGKHIGQ